MKFGSLFSGIGGFDLGLERASMICVWQAENNKYANQVLANHWPNVKRYEDVRDVRRNAETIDLICGGFPCQDLSVAGKRAGLAGERSGLWNEFARIIAELRPRWVVIENVPGLLSSNKGRDMGILTGKLAELGYWWAYRVLDSQYFGVAQRRRRVFIVANSGDATAPAKVLFEPTSGFGDLAPSRETRQVSPPLTATGVGAGRTGNERNELDFAIPTIARAITSREGLRQKVDQDTYVPRTFTVRGGKDGGGKGYLESEDLAMTEGGQPQWLAYHENQGGNLSSASDIARAIKASASNSYQDVYSLHNDGSSSMNADGANFRDDGLAYTQNSIDRGSVASPVVGVRRLTPIECERLQGFPDNWTGEQSDTQRYKMMGNAVTVNVIEWIGKRIMARTEI